jgi:hypothetical protein
MATKPIMLLDVDGPLNPFAAKATKRPEGYTTHRMRPTGWTDLALKPLRVWLDHNMGAKLKSLGYQIIWCTAWREDANEWISPHIGLPTDLEYIDWGPHDVHLEDKPYTKLHWKTTQIVSWLQEHHPDTDFIWVDDETTDKDEKFLKAATDVNVKIFTINPKTGITDSDLADMADWKSTRNG